MPIKGLTDQARKQFPMLGKLRKGDERPENGKAPGKELDHWRFTSEQQEVADMFAALFGEEPRELDVFLPYAKIEDNFSAWKEAWNASSLLHRCDGETTVLLLQSDGTYSREPRPCPGSCKEVGRLSVIIPDLLRAGYVGYVMVETHSINDILTLQGTLEAAVAARGEEDLRGIGFVLRRVRRSISTPSGSNGKRARRAKWLVELAPAVSWVQAQLEASERMALPNGTRPMLDSGGDEEDWDIETDAVIIDEDTGEILVEAEAQEEPDNGHEDEPPPVAWQGEFFGWLEQFVEIKGVGITAGEFYDWAKDVGDMREHLGGYPAIGAAQTDIVTKAFPRWREAH